MEYTLKLKKRTLILTLTISLALLPAFPFKAAQAPTQGTWSPTGSMTTPRVLHTATLLPDGRVLVAGGLNSGRRPTATAESVILLPGPGARQVPC